MNTTTATTATPVLRGNGTAVHAARNSYANPELIIGTRCAADGFTRPRLTKVAAGTAITCKSCLRAL